MIFHWIDNRSIIDLILKLAGYTYGHLISWIICFWCIDEIKAERKISSIGLFTRTLLSWILAENAPILFNGFKFGYELLLVNGLFFLGLYFIRAKE